MPMTLDEAKQEGRDFATGLVDHNVPKVGETYHNGALTLCTEDNIEELHRFLAFEASEHSRQYSPFELTARELNDAGEGDDDNPSSEELWEAFEDGVSEQIFADLNALYGKKE